MKKNHRNGRNGKKKFSCPICRRHHNGCKIGAFVSPVCANDYCINSHIRRLFDRADIRQLFQNRISYNNLRENPTPTLEFMQERLNFYLKLCREEESAINAEMIKYAAELIILSTNFSKRNFRLRKLNKTIEQAEKVAGQAIFV